MQNQSSPAQLLFPTVPANYCPEGSWSDIFNSFIQLYLNNGTVNIPGLGQVTPSQIQTINQNIQNLQNEYNALAVNQNSGVFNVVSQNTPQTFVASFATAMPNTNYTINAWFGCVNGTGTITPMSAWGVVSSTISTTGVTFWVANNNTDITKLYWSVSSISSN